MIYTKKPTDVLAKDYKAVFYVDGHSDMVDVPVSKGIQNRAMEVYEKHNGVISAVCHGTAGIVNLKTSNGEYFVNGKTINGYPEEYENISKPHFKTFPFLIKKTIESRGGEFKFSPRNTKHL